MSSKAERKIISRREFVFLGTAALIAGCTKKIESIGKLSSADSLDPLTSTQLPSATKPLPTETQLPKLQSIDLPPTNTSQPTVTETNSPPPPTASSTPTATEAPSPTASTTPTLEPTATQPPATATIQPPTAESTQVPPTAEPTVLIPTATQETAPPSNFPRTPSRKTGEVYYLNRTITFCGRPDGSLAEDTDENGYHNGIMTLITHVQSINHGSGTILVTDNNGGQSSFSAATIRIMDHPVQSTPANFFAGATNDLEAGDCVLLKKLDGSQGIPNSSDSILVWGFK